MPDLGAYRKLTTLSGAEQAIVSEFDGPDGAANVTIDDLALSPPMIAAIQATVLSFLHAGANITFDDSNPLFRSIIAVPGAAYTDGQAVAAVDAHLAGETNYLTFTAGVFATDPLFKARMAALEAKTLVGKQTIGSAVASSSTIFDMASVAADAAKPMTVDDRVVFVVGFTIGNTSGSPADWTFAYKLANQNYHTLVLAAVPSVAASVRHCLFIGETVTALADGSAQNSVGSLNVSQAVTGTDVGATAMGLVDANMQALGVNSKTTLATYTSLPFVQLRVTHSVNAATVWTRRIFSAYYLVKA